MLGTVYEKFIVTVAMSEILNDGMNTLIILKNMYDIEFADGLDVVARDAS